MSEIYFSGASYSDELYHYGVKGQKWGVRRFQDSSGKLTAAGRERYGAGNNPKQTRKVERQEWRAHKKELIKDAATSYKMSDKELIEKIGRLEREKRLMDLTYDRLTTSANPYVNMTIRSGKKVAESFIAGAGAYTLNSLTGLIPSAVGKGVFNAKEFAKWAFPNPNQKKK